MNPYEEAISIIGRTLASFDEDNLIPCFGFGDGIKSKFMVKLCELFKVIATYMWFCDLIASTHDQEVFSFYPDDKFCDGFEDVLRRYRELVPQLRLAGWNYTLLVLYIIIYITVIKHPDLSFLT